MWVSKEWFGGMVAEESVKSENSPLFTLQRAIRKRVWTGRTGRYCGNEGELEEAHSMTRFDVPAEH
jgi:hypothetical protein